MHSAESKIIKNVSAEKTLCSCHANAEPSSTGVTEIDKVFGRRASHQMDKVLTNIYGLRL
ncbi:MAG: hypothetical protein GQ546_06265 [Gammaproteobacteria bacterium]|nr:hypothetical protein [Gammaproteobacteria bacterium]